MKFRTEHDKTFVDLNRCKGTMLRDILEKVQALQSLQSIIENYFDAALAKHCQIANYENETLILLADSPSWSTKIRFKTPELLKQLSHHKNLNIKKINCLVRPKEEPKRLQTKTPLRLSQNSADIIKTTANLIKDDDLRKSLAKLGASIR